MNGSESLGIVQLLVPAASGLVGVALGGWITMRSQRKERQHRRLKEQLDGFYSPMLGLRAPILARSEVRVKVGGAADRAWRKLVSGAGPEGSREIEKRYVPDFQKIIEDDNRILVEEILPLYRKMVDYFSANMGLAEPSTRAYFGALLEFVDLWDRWLAKTIPGVVLDELGHSEEPLHAFYEDLAVNLDRLARELKK